MWLVTHTQLHACIGTHTEKKNIWDVLHSWWTTAEEASIHLFLCLIMSLLFFRNTTQALEMLPSLMCFKPFICKTYSLKGIVHPKMTILPLFAHCHSFQTYGFPSSVEHTQKKDIWRLKDVCNSWCKYSLPFLRSLHYLLLCSTKDESSYRFETTWGLWNWEICIF